MKCRYQVLVVDDDPELTTLISAEVSAAGYTTQTAATLAGAEAKMMDPASDISALVLDVQLPDGDGRDLCMRLRKHGSIVPIMLISGRTDEDSAVQGLEAGADAYIRKPAPIKEIIARLRRLCPAPNLATVAI